MGNNLFRDFHHAEKLAEAAREALHDASTEEGREMFAAVAASASDEVERLRAQVSQAKITKVAISPNIPVSQEETDALVAGEVMEQTQREYEAALKAMEPMIDAGIQKVPRQALARPKAASSGEYPVSKAQQPFVREVEAMRLSLLRFATKQDSPALRAMVTEMDEACKDARSPVDLCFRMVMPLMKRIIRLEKDT